MSGRREYDNQPDIRAEDEDEKKTDAEIKAEIEEQLEATRRSLENATIIR
jgi:hypothetical protein